MRDIFPIKIKGVRATLPVLIGIAAQSLMTLRRVLRRTMIYGAILSLQTQLPYHPTSSTERKPHETF